MRSKLGRSVLLWTATVLVGGLIWAPGAAHAAVSKCFGHVATIVSNRAVINGTSHADVIVAGKGNNTINGKGGADLICGGAGSDTINGGGGNDKISGGSGDDGTLECLGKIFLDGGPGNDLINGGTGSDCIKGDTGSDTLIGGPNAVPNESKPA